jgi:hypothetical protein
MILTMAMVTIVAYSSLWWLSSGNGKIVSIRELLDHGLQWKKC